MPNEGRLDAFISKVVADPAKPPDTILLTGFQGPSSEEGHTRIYQDATLQSYVDVPDDAIVHTEALPKEQSPLGGSYIWLKKDAEVLHGNVGTSRTKAKFLEGPIQAIGQFSFGGAAAPLPPSPVPAGCPVSIPQAICPSVPAFCPSIPAPCPSHPVGCPSVVAPCPTHPLTACPTPCPAACPRP